MKPNPKRRRSKAASGNGETRLSEGEMTAMIARRAHERARQRGLPGAQIADRRAASAEMLRAIGQDSAPPAGNGEDLNAESPAFLEADTARAGRERKPDGEASVEDPLRDWPEDG